MTTANDNTIRELVAQAELAAQRSAVISQEAELHQRLTNEAHEVARMINEHEITFALPGARDKLVSATFLMVAAAEQLRDSDAEQWRPVHLPFWRTIKRAWRSHS